MKIIPIAVLCTTKWKWKNNLRLDKNTRGRKLNGLAKKISFLPIKRKLNLKLIKYLNRKTIINC